MVKRLRELQKRADSLWDDFQALMPGQYREHPLLLRSSCATTSGSSGWPSFGTATPWRLRERNWRPAQRGGDPGGA